jgi:hypothetical protein
MDGLFGPVSTMRRYESVQVKRDPPIRKSSRADGPSGERGARGRLVVMTSLCIIAQLSRLLSEPILRPEVLFSSTQALEKPPRSVPRESETISELFVFRSGLEWYGEAKGIAEPHVGEPGSLEIHTECHMVERNAKASFFAGHFGGEHRHLVTESSQEPGERCVELIAKASASVPDDFFQDLLFVQLDFDTPVNIQVLERHVHEMTPVERA